MNTVRQRKEERGQRQHNFGSRKADGWITAQTWDSSVLTWQQEKEAQTTELQGVLGVDKSGRGNEGDAENTRTAERQEEPNLLPFPRHWDKAPPAPQQRPKLRMGVGEAIGTENRERKRTATHWTWRSAAFFVFWLPHVGSHNLQAGDRKILLWESDQPQNKAKPNHPTENLTEKASMVSLS